MGEEYDVVIDELDEEACRRLLLQAAFGRVAFLHEGEVMLLPVNSTVIDHRVVFRTGDETMLAAAGTGSLVAFESDEHDRATECGSSVLVRGYLWDVTDTPEAGAWHQLASPTVCTGPTAAVDGDRGNRGHRTDDPPPPPVARWPRLERGPSMNEEYQ